jgi:hypothetical protein
MGVDEFRLYHRKDGKVVKEYDDLLCASRYALMMKRAQVALFLEEWSRLRNGMVIRSQYFDIRSCDKNRAAPSPLRRRDLAWHTPLSSG